MKNLLITGHRGLLGSACVRHFSGRYNIITIDGRITGRDELREFFRKTQPDYVIHCAAKVGGINANKENPVGFLVENLSLQNIVMMVAADFGVSKFINVGTSCLYPDNSPIPVKERSLMHGPFNPDVEAYATAKLAGYQLCKAIYLQYGLNFMTVCPCNLYGPGDNYGQNAHVIPSLIRKMVMAKNSLCPMMVWGNGTEVREFLYADDCAAAIEVVMDGWPSPDLINIGTGISTTIRELVDTMNEVHGHVHVTWNHGIKRGIKEKTFDITQISRLGWKPKVGLKEGLTKAFDDFINGTPRL